MNWFLHVQSQVLHCKLAKSPLFCYAMTTFIWEANRSLCAITKKIPKTLDHPLSPMASASAQNFAQYFHFRWELYSTGCSAKGSFINSLTSIRPALEFRMITKRKSYRSWFKTKSAHKTHSFDWEPLPPSVYQSRHWRDKIIEVEWQGLGT